MENDEPHRQQIKYLVKGGLHFHSINYRKLFIKDRYLYNFK